MQHNKKYNDLLYAPEFEHDACGVGFIANIVGLQSHSILEMAIRSVENLTHRGALDADAETGDGAGILSQIPRKLFQSEIKKLGFTISSIDDLAVGMFFFPKDDELAQARCQTVTEETLAYHDIPLVGWRDVPLDPTAIGDKARSTMPLIRQVLMERPHDLTASAFEQKLYLARKSIESHIARHKVENFYIPSFSHQTIVYKGMFVAHQLSRFYLDLRNPEFETAIALFHQRYSTNTFPTWSLAQPFRMSSHNGEINTIMGNRNWMRARERELHSPIWGNKLKKLTPIMQPNCSDSMSLDNALEFLNISGRELLHSMVCLMPPAYENYPDINDDRRGLYEYLACLFEPWDGPAAVTFSDGTVVGSALDRNGLRPARYKITEDGIVVMASEVGVVELDDSKVVEKGRLGPGQVFAVDTKHGKLLRDDEVKTALAQRKSYASWVDRNLVSLEETELELPKFDNLISLQKSFGYATEDLELFLKPMVKNAKEAVGSMGDDTPPSVISRRSRMLYSYFKQKFAQVTNPPIDSLREKLVMSLSTRLGKRHSILEETETHARLIRISSPILTPSQFSSVGSLEQSEFQSETLSTLFSVDGASEAMTSKLDELCRSAESAIDAGKTLLILSDRNISKEKSAIPMLMVVGAIHHHLISSGKRLKASLILDTGEPREEHHFATLIGYGADAIHPYLAFATIENLLDRGKIENFTVSQAIGRYCEAVEKGLRKIMAKMGISTISSYRGAQIFEAIGLHNSVIDRCFVGTPSRVGGATFEELAAEKLQFHAEAFKVDRPVKIEESGEFRFRRNKEIHAFNPKVFKNLQKVAKSGTPEDYRKYAEADYSGGIKTFRDLLEFNVKREPIDLESVEPIESIVRRFVAASMSLGALSKEAHETIAIAMNRIGAKSSSGEGGENKERFKHYENGDLASSAIKQIASGRFGVTPAYLNAAKQLEIKMAQGSKPGEGGQIPGHKVSAEIARIRHSIPGVTLISPPPHHDIYSIEDLAQLIYDLKQANHRSKVAVKLVAEAGVGTIAAGVAKGYADVIYISGAHGGTGASPLSSMKNAGIPWELGLAETQQTLVLNNLRSRVKLRVDGGIRTGRDVVIAAMLGAEEYGFGTTAMIATGCIMARQCHLNTCPVGVATQDEVLRSKFKGSPEMVANFMLGVAQEVREILAQLGFRSMEELIGSPELLRQISDENLPKAENLELSKIIAQVDPTGTRPRAHKREWNHPLDMTLDSDIIQDAHDSIASKMPTTSHYKVRNTDRTIGAKISGEIAFLYGDEGLPDDTVNCNLSGSAGQSFGAFLSNGINLNLTGEANDYVGKGMAGGKIVVKPVADAKFRSHENSIVGNTVMYGATGGILYAAGRAGERFCVRNSGGRTVIEGVGDHACEYMTGGLVVVLGSAGRNFGAGMTGGVAYVLDENRNFEIFCNTDFVSLGAVTIDEDIEKLRSMVEDHLSETGSGRAEDILGNWEKYLPLFWKVVPPSPPPVPIGVSERYRRS